MATKYFFYSSEQLKFRIDTEKKMGKTFRVGHVFVNGTKKPFTEVSLSNVSRYPDAKLVASGDSSVIRFTPPTSE